MDSVIELKNGIVTMPFSIYNSKEEIMQKYLYIIIGMCCSLIFVGCASNNGSIKEEMTDNKTNITSETSSSREYANGDLIQIQLDDNVEIDAEITIPETLQSLSMKKVKAHRPELDEEEVKNLFLDEKEIESREVYEGFKCREFGRYDMVSYIEKKGGRLFYEPANVEYTAPCIDFLLNCLFTDPLFSSYNLDHYSQTKELSFASKSDIFHKVKTMFESFGVSISDRYESYALDHKTLQKEENPVDSDGNVMEQAKKDKWTDEDDAYYFILHQEINGVPVEQLSYGDGYEGTGIEATELSAIYGTKGWIPFIEDWGYCLEETETEQDILSVKDALNSFRKKCDMLLLDQKWTIRDISLKLLPVFIKDNEYEIRPVWFFEGTSTDKDQYERSLMILFDGITGKEITT